MKILFYILFSLLMSSVTYGQEINKTTNLKSFSVLIAELETINEDLINMGKGLNSSDYIHLMNFRETSSSIKTFLILLDNHYSDTLISVAEIKKNNPLILDSPEQNKELSDALDKIIALRMNNFGISCNVTSIMVDTSNKYIQRNQTDLKNVALVVEARKLLELNNKIIATLEPHIDTFNVNRKMLDDLNGKTTK